LGNEDWMLQKVSGSFLNFGKFLGFIFGKFLGELLPPNLIK
jgi:hypothetical protein